MRAAPRHTPAHLHHHRRRRSIPAWTVPVAGIALLLFGAIILGRTFLPVFAIELKYQQHRFFREVLGVPSLQAFFQPDLRIDLRGYATRDLSDGIVIPAIGLEAPVVYNVDPNDANQYMQALRAGIAHASATGFPDQGELGYYFAHSSTPEFKSQYNAVFYLLGKLKQGDEVYLWHQGKRFRYVVTDSITTTPEDTSFLTETYPRETIVLQTCWPPGTTRQRKLVFAQRQED